MSSKELSSSLKELRDLSLTERSTASQHIKSKNNAIPKNILKPHRISSGVCLYQEDFSYIQELQKFLFLRNKKSFSRSFVIRCALRLASKMTKENDYLLLSIAQEVENEDARKK